MTKYMKQVFIAALLALLFSAGAFAGEKVAIYIFPGGAKEPVLHGAKYLQKVLEERGAEVEITEGTDFLTDEISEADVLIALGISAEPVPKTSRSVPKEPESFAIDVGPLGSEGNAMIAAVGSDAVGAMYAAYELAEQIEIAGPDTPLLEAVKPRTASPLVKIRAVNPFLHVEAFNDPESWYYDEKFWEGYLDALSFSRHNLLDFHAMYGLISTRFPNAYLYLLHDDKNPDVGIPADQAAKNLEMFNKIIAMAKERGINTSLMSYHASWALSGYEKDEPRHPNTDELAEYTAEMVKQLIEKCPDLWMIGFRIGESGRREDFFRISYLEGLARASRPINLFTRSWQASPMLVKEIANANKDGKTYIEIKYNGEQLGLPYFAITSPYGGSASSYSYEDYSNYPRNYEIIWQIRANGTHRLFRWFDPEFAARTMLTVPNFGASGFSMEPMTAYYPMDDFFYRDDFPHDFFTWDHERNWFWYLVWGRAAYDPDTPKEVWLNELRKRYGAATPEVYDAFTTMSKIIPLIYSYRCLGPDHRNMAPEFENGGSIEYFTRNRPLDARVMSAVDEYVRHALFKSPFLDSKMSPFEMADALDKIIEDAEDAVEAASAKIGPDNTDFNCLKMEIKTLQALARYYSLKTRAATHYEFFKKTNHFVEFNTARDLSHQAILAWDELATLGEKQFHPFMDTLRMHTQEFSWREEGEELEVDGELLQEAEFHFLKEAESGRLAVYHKPVFFWHEPGSAVPITATVFGAGADSITLKYRKAGDEEYQTAPFAETVHKHVFASEIPAPGGDARIEYRIVAAAGGETAQYPSLESMKKEEKKKEQDMDDYLDETARKIYSEETRMKKMARRENVPLTVSADTTPPEIQLLDPEALEAGKKLRITAMVKDDGAVEKVVLHYKQLPTFANWKNADMEFVEKGPVGWDKYEAVVPLTPEGKQYYVAAADTAGNSFQYPDFRVEEPYRMVSAWDPDDNPHE